MTGEKIRTLKVQVLVPREIAEGAAVVGRAMIFAKYACGIDEPRVVSETPTAAGTAVVIEESATEVRRRGKRTQ